MAKRTEKASIAGLANRLNEARRMVVPLSKKLESIAALIAETEKSLGNYQEIADGVIVRKAGAQRVKRMKKVGRPAAKKKAGRPAAKKKAGRPAAKKKAGRPAAKKKETVISGRLKAYRKEAGLNQEAFAKKLGVNVASVRAWEQNRVNPRAKALKKIEKVLGGKAGKLKKTRKVRKTRKVGRPRKAAKAATPAAASPAPAAAPQAQ